MDGLPQYPRSVDQETFFSRFLPLPGLIVTTVLSIGLVANNAMGNASIGSFYLFVTSSRALTQLIVQVLSHLLGACMILTLTSLLNFCTRLYLAERRSVSLAMLTWWNQLTNHRLNWELPWSLGLFLVLFYGNKVCVWF